MSRLDIAIPSPKSAQRHATAHPERAADEEKQDHANKYKGDKNRNRKYEVLCK